MAGLHASRGSFWENKAVEALNPWYLTDAQFDAVMEEIDAELRRVCAEAARHIWRRKAGNGQTLEYR